MTAVQTSCTSPPSPSAGCVLETRRLLLRPLRLDDARALASLADNRRVAEMTASLPHPFRLEDAEEWIARHAAAAGGLDLAIVVKRLGPAPIGVCGYGKREEAVPEIGYWIGEPYWGQGYGTEAVRAMIDHAFSATSLEALAASCRVTNLASRRVLEKCGFQWTGAGLCRVRALGGSVPSDRFRLERRTWESLRAWGRTRLPRRARAATG